MPTVRSPIRTHKPGPKKLIQIILTVNQLMRMQEAATTSKEGRINKGMKSGLGAR